MANESGSELGVRLRQADEAGLVDLVERNLGRLSPNEALQALRNPFAKEEVIRLLLQQRDLQNAYEVRRQIAGHPQAPQVDALRLIGTLYWRDLMKIGGDSRVRPVVRRAADLRLAERMPGLAVGEKAAIARRGGPGVIAVLRNDPNTRVVKALLENPRLTEGQLMPLLTSDRARPQILELVARDRRWGVRYAIKVPICRNLRAPVQLTLSMLPSLKKVDLSAIASDPRLPQVVKRRASTLLGRP